MLKAPKSQSSLSIFEIIFQAKSKLGKYLKMLIRTSPTILLQILRKIILDFLIIVKISQIQTTIPRGSLRLKWVKEILRGEI